MGVGVRELNSSPFFKANDERSLFCFVVGGGVFFGGSCGYEVREQCIKNT